MKKEIFNKDEIMQEARVPLSFVIDNAVSMSAKQEKLSIIKRFLAAVFGVPLLPVIH